MEISDPISCSEVVTTGCGSGSEECSHCFEACNVWISNSVRHFCHAPEKVQTTIRKSKVRGDKESWELWNGFDVFNNQMDKQTSTLQTADSQSHDTTEQTVSVPL